MAGNLQGLENAAVLVSGGVESGILLSALAERNLTVTPIYVKNGLHWESTELIWLRRYLRAIRRPQIRPLEVLALPMKDLYGRHWSMTGKQVPDERSSWQEVYLPGRNLILFSKAAVYCALNGIGAMALGVLKTNHFPDSSLGFFEKFSSLIEKGLAHPIQILTPFSDRTKVEVIKLGRHLPLWLTFSCISPIGRRHCGTCNKCAERIDGFREAGVDDLTEYADRPATRSRTRPMESTSHPGIKQF